MPEKNTKERLRILCVCNHGNCRSVALAYLLKTIYGHEAIAVGKKDISNETDEMLKEWADRVIVLVDFAGEAPSDTDKITYIVTGEDKWHNPFNQELQHFFLKRLKDLNL